MIPDAYITQWAAGAPWPTRQQVEQDLVLSRLIVEIASDSLLGSDLAFRGGTCLHKVHLDSALRYSEDLDYTRKSAGGIKEHLTALRAVTSRIGLEEKTTTRSGAMVHFRAEAPAADDGEISIKVEIRIDETKSYLPRKSITYKVASRWFSGSADVSTFQLNEMMGTKLRALYQRSKGRDLFDLWHVLVAESVDDEKIVWVRGQYMGTRAFTYPQFRQNLKAKLDDPDFRDDLAQLVVHQPSGYDLVDAADLTVERLGPHMRNAPPIDEIRNGAWRA